MHRYALPFIGPLALVLLWYLFATTTPLVPSPLQATASLIILVSSGSVLPDMGATLFRICASFLIACILGIPIGLVIGSSQRVYASIEFVIEFLRSMPPTAIFPVFLLVFGLGDQSKIAAATFGAVLVIIFNTAYGILNASKLRVLAAQIMGASKTKLFTAILFWESLPQTFVGLRIGLNFAIILIIVTEMFVGTQAGLGKLILDYQITYDIPAMYAIILLTGIVGYLLNTLFSQTQRRLVHWT